MGKSWCERPKYNMTPRSGNIAKWMGENVEEIMRDSRDYAIDGEYWCEVLHGWLIVIPAIQNSELNRKQHQRVTHFNGITEKYQMMPKKWEQNSSVLKTRRFQSPRTEILVRWKRRRLRPKAGRYDTLIV